MSTPDPLVRDAGECQARLAVLWEKNLGLPVGIGDDYFERGGDSLRGTELLTWIYDGFGVEISLLDLFKSRTIATQTELLLSRMSIKDRGNGRPQTEYRYFGPSNARLFGALHRSRRGEKRPGVVLSYPIGQEYMRIHRTYVELARSLADSGHDVLRFDYYGCGDSSGETIAGTLKKWRKDIGHAIDEVRAENGIGEVYLVGARAGANLALSVACERLDISGLVLWEPVLNGRDYVTVLQKAHRALLNSNAKLEGYEKFKQTEWVVELLGFPITKELYDELVAIDLFSSSVPATADVLVLANSDKPQLVDYVASRRKGNSRIDYLVADESDAIWLKEDRQNKGVIPARAVQAITSWIARRNS